MDYQTGGGGYGKRPLWQWILIYLVVGGVVYGLVYYFVFAKRGGYDYGTAQGNAGAASQSTPYKYNYGQ